MIREFSGKRVAIYARYSSSLQSDRSIEDQVRRCADYVRGGGGAVDEDLIFRDMAISAASLKRPGFEAMMIAVDDNRVDVIVTEDLSRISRDIADSATLYKRLEYAGVPLIGIADGVDTGSKSAKMAYTVKSLFAEAYLDELRDKTLRGLRGRARAGYSTGGLPMGYRSMPVTDAYGTITAHRVEVDPEGAAIVRRIFALYLAGNSCESIARQFNAEKVPPPRAKTRHRRKGWVSSTVRAALQNEAYIGVWTYGERRWVKIPGTNTRRPRKGDPAEVIEREYDDRIIIDKATWEAVQKRRVAVRATYVKTDGPRASSSGRRNTYPLSGLLHCGACGAPMTITGGSSASYYMCSDAKKRGTCANKVSLREDVARSCLLAALHDRYSKPAARAHLHKKIAELLAARARDVGADTSERRARLTRIKTEIAHLVDFLARGNRSDAVATKLKELEAHANAESVALESMRARAVPVQLPTPEAVIARAGDLQSLMGSNPLLAREELHKLFENGRLNLMPQPTGVYIATGRIFPLAMLSMRLVGAGAQTSKTQPLLGPGLTKGPDYSWSSESCAGLQLDFPAQQIQGVAEVWVPVEYAIGVGWT